MKFSATSNNMLKGYVIYPLIIQFNIDRNYNSKRFIIKKCSNVPKRQGGRERLIVWVKSLINIYFYIRFVYLHVISNFVKMPIKNK